MGCWHYGCGCLLSTCPSRPTAVNTRRYSKIRNQWLLASRFYFGGCVPHGMEDGCASEEGRTVVRMAIDSLLAALRRTKTPLDADTLNLLGMEFCQFTAPIERIWLQEIGHAFLDLLDGKITCVPSSTDIMPGSKPYKRSKTNGSS